MTGTCVKDCKLLLMEQRDVRNGRYKNAEVDFYKGKMVEIRDRVTNIGGNDFVELVVQDPRFDWNSIYYMIKKSDRDKFFKRTAEEVVQCEILPTMNEMNAFFFDRNRV